MGCRGGSAPGSWSVYLAEHVSRVIAVDRAQLMPEACKPNILHVRQLAQEAVPEIIRWALTRGREQADLDMRQNTCSDSQNLMA